MFRFGLVRKLSKGQGGFSMSEVVIAFFLFSASVVGISAMMVGGGANVTLGSMESTAVNLATKRLEEIKSLPFYVPWDSGIGNQDIDDFMWDAGAYTGGTPGSNASQPGNPKIEDYGSIPGFPKYRRETSVQYMYVSGGQLAEAVMNSSWVPKSPTGPNFDMPKGGSTPSATDDLHAILIRVRVLYQTDFGIRTYSAQGLAGDLMVTGGTNNPVLVVNSINPTSGYYQEDTNLEVNIYLTASGGLQAGRDTFEVALWYAGVQDLPSIAAPTVVSSTQIRCNFNLADARVRPGVYNLSVYWTNKGWLDKSFRECFTVNVRAPVITSLGTYNWGYRKQTSRQVTINGDYLWGATVVMKGPHPSNTYTLPGTLTGPATKTQVVATFNISGDAASRPNASRWNLEITTLGGTVISDTTAKRFYMNPPPNITGISATSDPSYYNWAYLAQTSRDVRITGSYLYDLNTPTVPPGESAVTMSYGVSPTYTTANATFVSENAGQSAVVMRFNPNSSGASGTNPAMQGSRWNVTVTNLGGTDTSGADAERVLMNPPPTITSFSKSGQTVGTGTASGEGDKVFDGLTLGGTYIQNSPMGMVLSRNVQTPVSGTTWMNLAQGVSPSVNTAGTGISNLNMRMQVNPTSNSFMVYPGTSGATNADTAGTYYVYFANADGQVATTSLTVTVTHAQYTISLSSKQPSWGSVSGGGTYWQDQSATLDATPASGNTFRYWQYPVGTDWSSSDPYTFVVSQSMTIQGRFRKYLYNGTPIVTWQNGHCDEVWSTSVGPPELYCYTRDNNTGEDRAYATLVTSSTVNFAGASRIYFNWRMVQESDDSDSGGAAFVFDNEQGGNYNNYYQRIWRDRPFGWTEQSIDVSGYQGSYFVRLHSTACGWWDNDRYSTRSNSIYLE